MKDEALEYLRNKVAEIACAAPSARWYIFGSSQIDQHAAADLDLLVVYASDKERRRIRAIVSELSERIPLHLVLMSDGEEKETEFVSNQRATIISPGFSRFE